MSSYNYPNTEPKLALNLEDEDGMTGIDDPTAQPVEDGSACVNDDAWFGQGHNLAIGNGAQPSVAHLTSGMQSTADAMPRQPQLFHDDTTYQRRALRYALSGVGIMDASMSMAGPSQSEGWSSIGSGSSAAVPVGTRDWQDDGVAPAIDSLDPHFLLGDEFWVDCDQSGESRVDAYVNEQSSFQYTTDVPIDRSPEKTAYNTSLAPSRQAQEHTQLSPSPLLTAQYSRAHRHDQTYGPSAEPWTHVLAIASADGGQRQRPSVTHYVGSSTSLPTSRLSHSFNSTKASDATNDATTDTSLGPDGLGNSVATLVPVATQACGTYVSLDDLSVASTEWNYLDDEDVEGMDPGFEHRPSIHAEDTSWQPIGHLDVEESHRHNAAPPSQSVIPFDQTDKLMCSEPGCLARFSGRYGRGNLHRHLRLKHGHQEKQYCCGQGDCRKVFKRQDARLKHWRKRHSAPAPAP